MQPAMPPDMTETIAGVFFLLEPLPLLSFVVADMRRQCFPWKKRPHEGERGEKRSDSVQRVPRPMNSAEMRKADLESSRKVDPESRERVARGDQLRGPGHAHLLLSCSHLCHPHPQYQSACSNRIGRKPFLRAQTSDSFFDLTTKGDFPERLILKSHL